MRRLKFQFLALTAAALMVVGAISPARAQDPDDLKRAVARISLMDGQVSVKRGDSGDWVAGVINAPLMADDHIATGPNSRTEVQFDGSNLIRLGGNSEIHLTELAYGRYQMEFAKGILTYRVFRASNVNAEVDTPTVSVRPSKVGVYRISVGESGETEVTARLGDVEVFTPRGSQWVDAGQTMMARGTAADPEFQIVSGIPLDEWDHWNETRDRIFLQPSASAQYTDPGNTGMSGTEDLDSNGTWVSVPDYGAVWHPTTVGAGWAPYSAGRWVWEDWYGWTWVSYDPWGWAPYHYGRWFWGAGYGWCWYPGARFGIRSYWSPALVGWFGYGGGVGVGFGFGNIGWVPLAPYEMFHPWWGRGFYGVGAFNRSVNISSVNITNAYRNARVANGVSGMSAADFRNGHFGNVGHVSGEQIRTAGAIRGQVPIAPTSANLHYTNRAAGFTPQGSANTRFFSHQQASLPQRIPFAQQQRALSSVAAPGGAHATPQAQTSSRQGAMPTTRQETGAARPQTGAPANMNRPSTGNSTGSNGWRRFGDPSSQGAASQAAGARNEPNAARGNASLENTRPAQSQGSTNGWQRFGSPGGGSQNGAPRSEPAAPRYNAPSNSAPRYSAPSQQRSAPAPSYSAPRGGGGGGGSHPSGGGGHSGGGGGHHR
jgi:uncharacterized protein DUF6600/FecR-like protein